MTACHPAGSIELPDLSITSWQPFAGNHHIQEYVSVGMPPFKGMLMTIMTAKMLQMAEVMSKYH